MTTILIILSIVGIHVPACPTEDAIPAAVCVWDASQSGNGAGRSFLALSDGTVIY